MARSKTSKPVPPNAPHSDRVSLELYSYLRKPPAMFRDYVVSDKQTSQSRIAGRSIAAKVDAASERSALGGDVAYRGYSGEVSSSRRPVHKAGKRSWKRV
jgi:hypothetical protein